MNKNKFFEKYFMNLHYFIPEKFTDKLRNRHKFKKGGELNFMQWQNP